MNQEEKHIATSAPETALAVEASAQHQMPANAFAAKADKKIADTTGGKATNFFIDWVLGFGGNSGASLFVTYFLNPKQWVKDSREWFINKPASLIPGHASGGSAKKFADGVRSTFEILFMMISGTAVTLIMTPLVSRREKIGYKINQMLGRDTDVLTDDMKKAQYQPKTIEEFVEWEISKRVDEKQNWKDLWKARIATCILVIGGDMLLNFYNRTIEDKGRPGLSTDTMAWKIGGFIPKILPPKLAQGWSNFFANHGASIEDMRKTMSGKDIDGVYQPGHMDRLTAIENQVNAPNVAPDETRMVFREQFRLVTKEIGWTLALATAVRKMTNGFHNNRVKKERAAAIEDVKQHLVTMNGETYLIFDDRNETFRLDDKTLSKLNVKPNALPSVASLPSEPLDHNLQAPIATEEKSAKKWVSEEKQLLQNHISKTDEASYASNIGRSERNKIQAQSESFTERPLSTAHLGLGI